MSEECRKVLKSLGEAVINTRVYRDSLLTQFETLYGERLPLSDALSRWRRDLEAGRIIVADNRMCGPHGCVDLPRFILSMARYYDWLGERRKRLRDVLLACEVGE